MQEIPGLRWFVSASSDGVQQYPQFRVYRSQTESLRPREAPGVGTFFMTGDQFRLPEGLRMVWRTTAPPARGRGR
jgi:hypothetical protein